MAVELGSELETSNDTPCTFTYATKSPLNMGTILQHTSRCRIAATRADFHLSISRSSGPMIFFDQICPFIANGVCSTHDIATHMTREYLFHLC